MACSQPEVVVTGTGFSNGEYGEKEAYLPGEGVGTNGRCLSDHSTESVLGGKAVRDSTQITPVRERGPGPQDPRGQTKCIISNVLSFTGDRVCARGVTRRWRANG